MYLIVRTDKILRRQLVNLYCKTRVKQFVQLSRQLHSCAINSEHIVIRKLRDDYFLRYKSNSGLFSGGIFKVITNGSLCYRGCQIHSQYKTQTCGELCKDDVGKFVTLRGFLQYKRLGLFCILRDSFGITQVIVNEEMTKLLAKIPYESCIEASGEVVLRPVDQINKNINTGEIEVVANDLKVLNKGSNDIPFLVRDYVQPTEQLRSKYRYLDLRRPHLQENLRFRSKLEKRMRDYLQDVKGFLSINTPTLSFGTTGGAQEFIVQTQIPGEYYSLVQSPQTYKQLAIIGGIEKYFQFANCYRDETGQKDRQPEFMQLDLEMAYATASEVQELMEEIIVKTWPENLPVPKRPFPFITYKEAMQDYGVDKPDLRFQWKICDVSSIISQSEWRYFVEAMGGDSSVAKAFIVPGGQKYITKAHFGNWMEIARNEAQLPGVFVLYVQNDRTLQGKAARAFSSNMSSSLIEALGAKVDDVIVLAAGHSRNVLKLLGKLRLAAANSLEQQGVKVRGENSFSFVWVVDFPLFEQNEKTGHLESCHHPFTAPIPEDEHLLQKTPLRVTSQHYDLVLNGSEIAGGSIRIHDEKMQRLVLEILGGDFSELDFFLEALTFGAPPHGGIALGFDRYVSILRGTDSIRDVIAFPKSKEGRCAMSMIPYSLPKVNRNLNSDNTKEKISNTK